MGNKFTLIANRFSILKQKKKTFDLISRDAHTKLIHEPNSDV